MNTALRPLPGGAGRGLGRLVSVTGPVWLRDRGQVDVRFIRPDDEPRLIELFQRLSPETIYRRFLHARTVLPAPEAARFANVDHRERDALVACRASENGKTPILAVARYAKQDEESAEGALVVDDAYQRLGLGTLLLRRLITLLQWRGFRYLRGTVLSENGRMLRLLRATGHPLKIVKDDGAYRTQLDLAPGRVADHAQRRAPIEQKDKTRGKRNMLNDDKVLALIAHDGKKADMLAFATSNRDKLADYRIIATATTGRLLREEVGLEVEGFHSGPLGGDVQIAARIAGGEVDAVFFLVDPLDRHPHDADIQAVQRVCNVHDVPLATNVATANLIISAETV